MGGPQRPQPQIGTTLLDLSMQYYKTWENSEDSRPYVTVCPGCMTKKTLLARECWEGCDTEKDLKANCNDTTQLPTIVWNSKYVKMNCRLLINHPLQLNARNTSSYGGLFIKSLHYTTRTRSDTFGAAVTEDRRTGGTSALSSCVTGDSVARNVTFVAPRRFL